MYFGQLTACPHRAVNWTIRFGLSQGMFSNSSQQHARTGGGKFSATYDLDYQVRAKSGEEQLTAACPHWGSQIICDEWVVLSQVRTKSGEVFRQLTAACPHKGSQIISYVWIGLFQVRTKSGKAIGLNSDSSQQHARTGDWIELSGSD